MPNANTESFQLATHTFIGEGDVELYIDNHIIKDFTNFVRNKFGDVCTLLSKLQFSLWWVIMAHPICPFKLSLEQLVALSWLHDRCTHHHHHQLRLNIQQDIIDLVAKLFSSSASHMQTPMLLIGIKYLNLSLRCYFYLNLPGIFVL